MSGIVYLIGILAFGGLVLALAGPIRAWFSDESKLFLHDIRAADELDLEEAQREATAEARPRVGAG